jgi:hypothetical protein
MGHDAVVSGFVIVAAAAIVVQGFILLGLYRIAERIRMEISATRQDVREQFAPLAQSLEQIIADSRQPLAVVTTNLADVSRILRERVAAMDTLASELADRTRMEIGRVDRALTDILEKVENTTDVIQKNILGPITEISALLKGFRSGLGFLFSRHPASRSREAAPDEPMFI